MTVLTMAGVFQKTAEWDVSEGVIASYFTDSLQSFVNDFKLQRNEVLDMEDQIIKQFCVSEMHYIILKWNAIRKCAEHNIIL